MVAFPVSGNNTSFPRRCFQVYYIPDSLRILYNAFIKNQAMILRISPTARRIGWTMHSGCTPFIAFLNGGRIRFYTDFHSVSFGKNFSFPLRKKIFRHPILENNFLKNHFSKGSCHEQNFSLCHRLHRSHAQQHHLHACETERSRRVRCRVVPGRHVTAADPGTGFFRLFFKNR